LAPTAALDRPLGRPVPASPTHARPEAHSLFARERVAPPPYREGRRPRPFRATGESAGMTLLTRRRLRWLPGGACRYQRAWIKERGAEAGPLFCPVSSTGAVRLTRMRGESLLYILRRRQDAVGLDGISPIRTGEPVSPTCSTPAWTCSPSSGWRNTPTR
jgi:hypothetical protein